MTILGELALDGRSATLGEVIERCKGIKEQSGTHMDTSDMSDVINSSVRFQRGYVSLISCASKVKTT